MMYIRFLFSLRNVEDLLQECGIDICHGTVRFWQNKYGLMLAAGIQQTRVQRMRSLQHCRSRKLPGSADRTEDLLSDVAIPAERNLGASRLPFLTLQHVCRIAGEFRQARNQGTPYVHLVCSRTARPAPVCRTRRRATPSTVHVAYRPTVDCRCLRTSVTCGLGRGGAAWGVLKPFGGVHGVVDHSCPHPR